MTYRDYLERTYAAWLGKIIGIRLGAPVEGWSCEEIRKTYGKVNGYLVDYGTFAADDDSNGPLFFVRALEKNCDSEISAEAMGNNVLNWLCDGHGFFWWGGVGIATEHTAYDNLKKGIRAPQSGSAEVNGIDLAEQIGGQIFSDCWGYVAPDNPELAKKLAIKMSSVTHDQDGIEGGVFVAVCIALAYRLRDTREIIDEALTYLNPQSTYVTLCKAVIEQVDLHPNDSETVLKWIQENHGYDKYPGVCHILPNTAIMIWAMLYGKNEFDQTMNMLCEAGWDTDCTLGNVGSIMGAMLGLEGIDKKWTDPINDMMLSSSCMGSENIDTVSSSVRVFTELGWKLKGLEVPSEYKRDRHHIDFILPRSTGGLRVNKHRYFETNLVNDDEKLKVVVNNTFKDTVGKVYLKTYYHVDEIYDARYEPSFSPIVYPNETVTFTVSNPEKLDALFNVYALMSNGTICRSTQVYVDEAMKLSLQIPECDAIVDECGLEVHVRDRQMRKYFWIHEVDINPTFKYTIDFTQLQMEDWGYDFGGLNRKEVMGCVTHHGKAYTDEKGLHLDGMLSFGDMYGQINQMEVSFNKKDEDKLQIMFDVKGFMNYCAISIEKNAIAYIFKADGEEKIVKIDCEKVINDKITLKIARNRGLIIVDSNELSVEFKDDDLGSKKGAAALMVEGSDNCTIFGCKLEASNFQ